MDWEDILKAEPDIIILVDATWDTAASKVRPYELRPWQDMPFG